MRIGFHASHEQFPPERLRDLARLAEECGFEAVMSSDHFRPWSRSQGHAGYAWSWLGAAMQATSLPFGTMAIPGGWRYHPAIVAQAAATLARLFPGRLRWLALGSGEALNETVVGQGWPDKDERNCRLFEAADIIRSLWRGETVSRAGPIPTVDARIYSAPPTPCPLLIGAALTPETAEWVGGWADGLATVWMPEEKLSAVVDAFRRGGGSGKTMAVQMHVSWARTEAEGRRSAVANWRYNIVDPSLAENVADPAEFERLTRNTSADDLAGHVVMTADPGVLADAMARAGAFGFDELYLHQVGEDQEGFVRAFRDEIRPQRDKGDRAASASPALQDAG